MTPRRRRALWLLLGAGAVLAGSVASLYALLLPPHLEVPPPGAVLAGLELVNPGGTRRSGVTLVVEGERIAEIAERPVAGASSRYAGCTALPGLVDLHVHHPPATAIGQRELFALLFLAHGVTSIRDVGTFDVSLASHRRAIDSGARPGPRSFSCGAILDGDPPAWPGARVVREPGEAEPAVAALAAEGADCVKVYNHLDEPSLRAIQDAAERRGLRVVAHVPFAVPFESLEHLEVQHLMGLEDAAHAGEETAASYVAHSVAAGISHTPTLVAFARAAHLDRRDELLADPAAALLPRVYRETIWDPERNPLLLLLTPDGVWSELAGRVERMQLAVRQLHEAGVPVLAGTDVMNPFVVPGASLHEEIGLLAAAGLGVEAALDAATRGAGGVLGVPGLGVLEVGAPADVAIFRNDPTRDLGALASLVAVVARGRLYDREVLLAAAARQRAHFESPLYDRLFRVAARAVIAATAPGPGEG
jgi:imidazolonepropionase-like amidohydrolase